MVGAYRLGKPVNFKSGLVRRRLGAIGHGVIISLVSPMLLPAWAAAQEVSASIHTDAGNGIAGSVRRIAPDSISPELDPKALRRDRPRAPLSELARPKGREMVRRSLDGVGPNGDWSTRRLFRPVVSTANRIEVQGYVLTLDRIVAPALGDYCGQNLRHRCGVMARTAIRRWLRGRAINCLVPSKPPMKDDAGKLPILRTTCELNGKDIGAWLVTQGWALPIRQSDDDSLAREGEVDLAALAEQARKGGRGFFALGGWSPQPDCGGTDGQTSCEYRTASDDPANLPTPRWAYPVATILPSAEAISPSDAPAPTPPTVLQPPTSADFFR